MTKPKGKAKKKKQIEKRDEIFSFIGNPECQKMMKFKFKNSSEKLKR